MNKKYYCVGYGDSFQGCKNLWSINYTDKLNGYNTKTDKYGTNQVFETEAEAINSILELRKGGYYKKIGY